MARSPAVILALALFGCDDPSLPSEGGGGSGGSPPEGGSPPASAPTASLPQALDGAMHANPDVYATVPVHVNVTGDATDVTVVVDEVETAASDEDGDGTWTAQVPIDELEDGEHALEARATRDELSSSETADLVIAREGIQLTDFASVGSASTPRVFMHDGALYLTHTDRSDGMGAAWLQRLDGGYRPIGEKIAIVDSDEATLYARTALGDGAVGVLYQGFGSPYSTFFTVVGLDGSEIVAPIDLDPPDSGAYSGGDLAFDGTHFVVTFKIVDTESQKLLFARIDAETGEVTGPVTIATSGAEDPEGEFLGFSPVAVEPFADGWVVTFTRERYIQSLELAIPITQWLKVDDEGAVVASGDSTSETFLFHREARLSRIGGDLLMLFSATDLLDASDNPPYLFFAKPAEEDGTFAAGEAGHVFVEVDDRDDPFLLEHPTRHAVLAWTDHRSYTLDGIENGRIELYVAPFDADLHTGEPAVFPHARFVAGLSELNGVLLGTNVALTWVDERHGLGIADPKPEIYLETAWY